ncbi:uncharacterized protein L203_102384 [Cryptococcus depauperatus CBS 7841]|uniref:Uncharacterized protein n=1 Tax=Cryptococcus depauperatus CBS 7841 TaxID=1295531 RepID=A0AAJ8JRU3_9TREE
MTLLEWRCVYGSFYVFAGFRWYPKQSQVTHTCLTRLCLYGHVLPVRSNLQMTKVMTLKTMIYVFAI